MGLNHFYAQAIQNQLPLSMRSPNYMLHPFKDWSQKVICEGASFHKENNPIKIGAQPGPLAIKVIKT